MVKGKLELIIKTVLNVYGKLAKDKQKNNIIKSK